ncbi:fimbria/pilus outer membrane usher protein [Shewanella oncorhynchi]|uniref:fimbria/pilus outer membrane usher protein n=1 Tax=Shewanella oncorhynchi TaxID=2726434 RepID=UPI0039EFF7F6
MKFSMKFIFKSFGVKFICLMYILPFLLLADDLREDDFQEFTFDDSLLFGGYGDNYISRFNSAAEEIPGQYQVDIYINNTYLNSQIIDFYISDSKKIFPCLDIKFWKKANVISTYINEALLEKAQCELPDLIVNGVTTLFNSEKLRLDISIPQAYLQQAPRGFVESTSWDAGESAGFISYNSNFYQTNSRGMGHDMSAFYTGLNSGINLGLWRLRNQSNYQYSEVNHNSQDRFNSIRTFAIRVLPELSSELLLGDTYTRGNVFGSLGFSGVQLYTDNRMLPDSQRGYAPVVRGLANSTAKVVIKQNDVNIYQTTVASGPFIISDLYPTSYEGDLLVEITEADGKVSNFTVPFSAVPGSLREGHSQYAFSFGEATNFGSGDYFADAIFEYGLSNALTLNSGARLADDYLALSIGSVLGTEWGAFGVMAVHSISRTLNEQSFNDWRNGWRLGLNYSRSFSSGTSLSLAGYHYSTESYRELNDILSLRKAFENGNFFESETYRQRVEMSLSLNQSFDDFGYVYLSGSKRQYRDGRDDDDQLQIGYSVALGDWNVGLTFSRQYMSQVPLQNGIEGYRLAREGGFDIGRIKEDLLSLNISIPLGRRLTNMLSTGYSHSSQGSDNYSLGLSGIVSDDKAWTYGLNTTVQQFDETSKSLSLNTQKRFSQVAVSGSYSIADSYQQVSAGMTGAIVAHSGGMTLSQNLSDTFAIVEADGATGARVTNNWGTEIDNRGYAIIPSLTPYRSNRITLDTGNMRGSTELLNAQQQVIPYAGAIVKMKFDTRFGIPVLFITQLADGGVIPIGAEVTDENGSVLGMVGQAGIAYVRASKAEGKLIIQWGDENAEQCYFDYELELEVDLLQRLQVTCGQQS